MTGQVGRVKVIDGKYEVLREVSVQGPVTLSEVRAAEGVTRQVAWFNVATPADRQAFHAYRTALRALSPAGLTDVVARPGAFYAVWQPVTGQPLEAALAHKGVPQDLVENVQALAGALAEHGYALEDAQVLVEGHELRVAYLTPQLTPRTPEDIAARNAATLAPLKKARVKRRREPGAWLTFIPGLLLLGGATYVGAQAVQIYLNPPVKPVSNVVGQAAKQAAQELTSAGFRVEYVKGQAAGRAVGSIIRQDPAANSNLPVGRLVTLTVNNPPAIEVPRLEEMTPDQARDALKGNAMTVGKIVKVDGTLTGTPEGRIVAQLPEAGSTAQQGQAVQLMVSTGITGKKTWLPILAGFAYEDALKVVRTAGLVVTKVTPQPSDRKEGTVLSQTPAAFENVTTGSPVTLTVAAPRYSAPSRPAGSLPLPPPVQDPEPAPQTEPSTAEPVTPEPSGVDSAAGGSEEIPAVPVTDATPQVAGPAPRSVSLSYTFPTDLPGGTYTLVVRDASGERPLNLNTEAAALAGKQISTTATVTGDAVFVIRRDGQDFAQVTP
ncbi:PASTA domain-containing protein [Deinococcus actinosclerus]|uniref:Serine/threonine protein kinase n=1 Tax=Deinococcus actinosclerus TaxID=1768108 RepID=A0ABM5X450_9DEIO|nr:PASTA domain-containing protein [Deinococcus actinosclerus]ALW88492.1 serine/threonine protein kinase [Deinococcus actinosclerus]